MEDKVLNAIGQLTIEINGIKADLKNKNCNDCLQLIEDVETKVSALEKDVKQIVMASNEFNERLTTLENKLQENIERQRKAGTKRYNGYKITDEISFGGRLRALRKKSNLFIDDLSKQTLVPVTTIGSIENFKMKYIAKEYLEALNKFFNYDFSEYVDKESERW